ncbi:MAG: hypothetical protein ACHRHE_17355 [Tepidisphaerales bacterium]
MNEHESKSVVPAVSRGLLRPLGSGGLIWKMIGLALGLHLVLLLVLSPRLFTSDAESPERLFERGENELAQGHYPEAMALFQKVMDLQPKLPPVFEKAAEQHRTAERLARQYTARTATTRESGPSPEENAVPIRTAPKPPPDRPTVVAPKPPATQPAGTPFIPPELRPK